MRGARRLLRAFILPARPRSLAISNWSITGPLRRWRITRRSPDGLASGKLWLPACRHTRRASWKSALRGTAEEAVIGAFFQRVDIGWLAEVGVGVRVLFALWRRGQAKLNSGSNVIHNAAPVTFIICPSRHWPRKFRWVAIETDQTALEIPVCVLIASGIPVLSAETTRSSVSKREPEGRF